jgi:hypothetical protein
MSLATNAYDRVRLARREDIPRLQEIRAAVREKRLGDPNAGTAEPIPRPLPAPREGGNDALMRK